MILIEMLIKYWTILQLIFVIGWCLLIWRYKVSGQRTAHFGFILLFITMVLNILGVDSIAGKAAEFSLLFFIISFVQEFYHFLKYENK